MRLEQAFAAMALAIACRPPWFRKTQNVVAAGAPVVVAARAAKVAKAVATAASG